MRTLVYGVLAVSVLLAAGWGYGQARHAEGRAECQAEGADQVIRLYQRLAQVRRDGAARLEAAAAVAKQKEDKFHATIAQLKARDASFAAWLAQPVHPLDVDLVRGLRDDPAASRGLPAR